MVIIRRLLAYIICILIIISGYLYSNSFEDIPPATAEVMTKGVILEMIEMEVDQQGGFFDPEAKQWLVKVEITEGTYAGRIVETTHFYGNNPAFDFMVYSGDEVILSLVEENNELQEAFISDISRDKYLKLLFTLFVVSILVIGAWQGVKTIVSLVATGWAVVSILLPGILVGEDPIWITILVCTGITIVTHMLITGFTKKSLAAISGTTMGIIIGGLLAKHLIELSRITGLATEESRLLFFSLPNGQLDITGILFAGIVLGSLGAVMDVAMSIASSINEIYLVNTGLSFRQLVKSGLNVGRDIIGTMANTLILAYTGSALPLMLLLLVNNVPYLKFINLDMVATEIIRALSGSIGLFLAVPFTALISAALYRQPQKLKEIFNIRRSD